jgi:hypothetical protein
MSEGYVCNPVDDTFVSIPGFSGWDQYSSFSLRLFDFLVAKTLGVLWESRHVAGKYIFITYDDAYITTYVFHQFIAKGNQCQVLGTTKLPFGLKPILLYDGVVTCQVRYIVLHTTEQSLKHSGQPIDYRGDIISSSAYYARCKNTATSSFKRDWKVFAIAVFNWKN